MSRPTPTQERIKELFHYDPETGVFTHKGKRRDWSKAKKYGRIGAARIGSLGYALLMIDGSNYIAGPVAWCYMHGEWPSRLKYISGNKADLRLANLRVDGGINKSDAMNAARLRELLHYEPTTGWLTWRVHSSGRPKPGERAGGLQGLGYRAIGVDYKKYLEHTLIWLWMIGEWPTKEIDHINGDKSDNRWENLREATRSEQGHNKPRGVAGKSGFPGVYLHGGKYRSRITVDGVHTDFGWYVTIAQARIARLLGEKQIFGRFTTWLDERDGVLPLGDGFISVLMKDNRLYVLSASGEPIECDDVSKIEVIPVTEEGHVLN